MLAASVRRSGCRCLNPAAAARGATSVQRSVRQVDANHSGTARLDFGWLRGEESRLCDSGLQKRNMNPNA